MTNFEKKVFYYIKNNNLISSNKVLLAFSYGIDSRALLNVLLALKYEVILLHVNHKVRKESEIEEKETLELAKKYNLKCYIKHLEKQDQNFEDFARRERYNFFKEVAKQENTNILLTAHHKDDNLETIILRLITGSNLYGYAGIHNKVTKDSLTIVRPFLCVTKDEIKAYQKEIGFTYFEDSTNEENDHMRNRIRHNIIPLLKEENSSVLDKSISFSNQLNEAFDYIRTKSIDYLTSNNFAISNSTFKELDAAQRHDIICLLLEHFKIDRNTNIIYKLDSIILANKPQVEFKLSDNFVFYKRYDKSYIEKEKTQNLSNLIKLNYQDNIVFNNFNFYFSKEKPLNNEFWIKLCYNDLEFPLTIRTRINGDFIVLSKGKKKIKDLFIDKKINIDKRNSLPLIINNGNILWIPSVAKSELIRKNLENGDIYLVAKEIKNA